MDAKAQRKALFRSRIRETSQKREKRTDSPLVRYNEDDQPVCRVCNVTLKSESLLSAHLASRKHHEAIENIKAAGAARQTTPNSSHLGKQQNLQEPRVSFTLSDDFFDTQDAKKQKTEHAKTISRSGPNHPSMSKAADDHKPTNDVAQSFEQMDGNDAMQANVVPPESFSDKWTDDKPNSSQKSQLSKDKKSLEVNHARGFLPTGFFDKVDTNGDNQATEISQQSENVGVVQLKQVKGALPAGFFDNKDADLRARGIEPVKVDINDAYKEFEKEIQVDLQEVDDRLEEEEIDAAEVRGEIEFLEQKTYRERVEMVKKQLIEAKEARLAKVQKSPEFMGKDSSDDSSNDSDADEDFSIDWRAKRL
ncbi:hypothetical protein KSP39_PZI015431 [Platanthera zijinensis]|uniref:C2H2-type domain-containing protein n=1 Tax=Platanthera zijinensis TaxID=2320716 RepID=A0AAP0B9A7_9ASPA